MTKDHRVFALGLLLTALVASPVAAGEREIKTYTIPDTRDMRFCEFIIAKPDGLDVYNTTGMNDCPVELFDNLDIEAIKEKFGAIKVELNGPKFWMMDEQTLEFGETETFGGIEARWAARLDPAVMAKAWQGSAPYAIFNPKKKQRMVYAKGKPVFEIIDPEGNAYVLQAHGKDYSMETLPSLGGKMTELPEGWSYRARVLEEDLILDLSPDQTIYALGDEFHQYYTRPPEQE